MQNRRTPKNHSYHGESLQGSRSTCLSESWLHHRRKNGPMTRGDSPSHNLKYDSIPCYISGQMGLPLITYRISGFFCIFVCIFSTFFLPNVAIFNPLDPLPPHGADAINEIPLDAIGLTCQPASAPDHHSLGVIPVFFGEVGGSGGDLEGPPLTVLVVIQHSAGCRRNHHRAFPRS